MAEPKATATIRVIQNGYVMEVKKPRKGSTDKDSYEKRWITREYCAKEFAELGECLKNFLREPKTKNPASAARSEGEGS